MGQKQVPTSPPSCGACPVALLATTPQDRLTLSQRGGSLGRGQRLRAHPSGNLVAANPFALPPRSHVTGTLKEDLTAAPCHPHGSAGGNRRRDPWVRTPRVRGCSAAGRASAPTMRPWRAAEAAAHPPLLPPHHPEPGLRTFPNKYASQVRNYLN